MKSTHKAPINDFSVNEKGFLLCPLQRPAEYLCEGMVVIHVFNKDPFPAIKRPFMDPGSLFEEALSLAKTVFESGFSDPPP